jgi:hypothetical protein
MVAHRFFIFVGASDAKHPPFLTPPLKVPSGNQLLPVQNESLVIILFHPTTSRSPCRGGYAGTYIAESGWLRGSMSSTFFFVGRHGREKGRFPGRAPIVQILFARYRRRLPRCATGCRCAGPVSF